MSPELAFLPWFISGITLVALVLINRQKQNAQLFARSLHARLEAGREGYELLSTEHDQTVRQWQEARQNLQDTEYALRDAKGKLARKDLETEKLVGEMRETLHVLERRKDHLAEEAETLKQQLREADDQLKAAVIEERESLTALHAKRFDELKQRYDTIKSERDELISEKKNLVQVSQDQAVRIEKISTILRQVNPEDLRKNKRKLKQMEQLYTSMRGLKDLADERIKNWEVALVHLSSYILRKPFDAKTPIGPLVGEALEEVGARLVDDDELGVGIEVGDAVSEDVALELGHDHLSEPWHEQTPFNPELISHKKGHDPANIPVPGATVPGDSREPKPPRSLQPLGTSEASLI